MIESLTVRNFQSHEATEVEFGPGLNVIQGSSDVGKTALIRALEWVRTNRPLGASFIRNGTRKAEVVVTVSSETGTDDGGSAQLPEAKDLERSEIYRARGKGLNCYMVDGVRYEAPGTKTPPEVFIALGLTDLNVQSQLDGPFLILDSPGKIAEALNEATGLDEGELVVSWLNERVRGFRSYREDLESKRMELEERIEGSEFDGLEYFESLVNRFERIENDLSEARRNFAELQKCLDRIEVVKADLNRRRVPKGVLEELEKLEEQENSVSKRRFRAREQSDKMAMTVEEIKRLNDRIESLQVPKGAGKKVGKLSTELSNTCTEKDKAEEKKCKLIQLLIRLRETEDGLRIEYMSLEERKGMYEKLASDIRTCPLCDTELDEGMSDIVLERLING